MNKCYNRIDWKNYPNVETPINRENLNKIDTSLDEVDNRIISQNETKATKEEVAPLIKEISFNETDGIFTITRKNGSKFIIDTKLEKIATNFGYEPATQQIYLTLIDGTIEYIDLSALITEYEFLDTDTVSFFVDENGKVSAIVKEGSIEEKHLRPNYLAEIKVVEENAKADAEKSKQSAKESAIHADLSKSYAIGTSGAIRKEDDTDNAKYYSEEAKKIAEKQNEALDTKVSKAGDTMTGMLKAYGGISLNESCTESDVQYLLGVDSAQGGAVRRKKREDVEVGSAKKWSANRSVNGMSIDGTENRANYGTCSTAAATAAKDVECTGYVLQIGGEITVKFIETNSTADPTLNVNGTGAKPIYYRGAPIASDCLAANHTYMFRYNGAQYELVGDINTDTDTWKANTATSEGYVPKGEGNPNKVWGTDEYGNPSWIDYVSGSSSDIVKLTREEYDELPDTKLTDDKIYFISEGSSGDSGYSLEERVRILEGMMAQLKAAYPYVMLDDDGWNPFTEPKELEV